jgi:hypothetical protein
MELLLIAMILSPQSEVKINKNSYLLNQLFILSPMPPLKSAPEIEMFFLEHSMIIFFTIPALSVLAIEIF